jgi:hypothetical protein
VDGKLTKREATQAGAPLLVAVADAAREEREEPEEHDGRKAG